MSGRGGCAEPPSPLKNVHWPDLVVSDIGDSGPPEMVRFDRSNQTEPETEKNRRSSLLNQKAIIESNLRTLRSKLVNHCADKTNSSSTASNKPKCVKKKKDLKRQKGVSYWNLFVSRQERLLRGVSNHLRITDTAQLECIQKLKNDVTKRNEEARKVCLLTARLSAVADIIDERTAKLMQLRRSRG